MYIFFGVVKKYFPERGFGFITHPLSQEPNKEIFFHISKVEDSNKDIAEKLSVYDKNCTICFWYELETTHKGEQLKKILKSEDVSKLDKDDSAKFIERIELMYENIDNPIPFWLNEVTVGLIGMDGEERLDVKRKSLIQKRNEEEELQRIEVERLKKIAEEKLEKERARKAEEWQRQKAAREMIEEERRRQKAAKEMIEEEEFEQLVAEIESKDFKRSAQVSKYIIRNKLGNKYKHISGVLEMANKDSLWKFNGGFPTNIYRRLCIRLGLEDEGTDSRVVGFTSFNDLE